MGKAETRLQSRKGSASGVIPTSQVIVLKEQDLDCDLGTAIQRIRDCEETSHSRILVVASDEVETDQDQSPRSPSVAPTTLGQVARRAKQTALEQLGAELAPLGSGFQHYLAEMRSALDQLAATAPGAPLQLLEQTHAWMKVAAEDLVERTERTARGLLRVDTHELLQDMSVQIETSFPGLRVSVGPGAGACCSARPADLAEGFFLGLALVAQRIGGKGSITVALEERVDAVVHRFLGQGDQREISEPEAIARFRTLIVDVHGGAVHHDALGMGATGLTIRLPKAN